MLFRSSFSVTVDGVLQRPWYDYDFNSDSAAFNLDVVFTAGSIPAAGAIIKVFAGSYWQHVDTLTVPGLLGSANFGYSLTTTTDGRQVIVGSPNDNITALNNAGSVYAFDRSVLRYLVSDVDNKTFELPVGYLDPVSVLLNGTFLQNTDQFMNGQFSVTGGDVVLNSSVTLSVGDVIEIESNIFQQVQKVSIENPYDEAEYGYSVDICPNNCSLYIGAPNDGSILIGAGSVERRVNQAKAYGIISSTIANPTLTTGDTLRIDN